MVNFTTCSILLFVVLITALLQLCCCQKAYSNVTCIARERRALLQLRNSFVDRSNRLSSWSGEDCCHWEGVGCTKTTGHVVKLDMRNPIPYDDVRYYDDLEYSASYQNSCLAGEINPSIVALKYLNYLDLSFNNFSGRQIPMLFGSLKNLKYLNLSNSHFEGEIPYHLGNLSRLQHLDLSGSYKDFLTSKSLSWVSKLHSLKSLNLFPVNLSGAQNWFQEINMLPSLKFLKLQGCQLHSLPSLIHVNLTSLTSLDLDANDFNSTIPLWLFNITSLTYLSLSVNHFHGLIPSTISQMNSLISLYLSVNKLTSPLPNSFSALSRLAHFDLGSNNFGGTLQFGLLSNLTSLMLLDLSSNKFHGGIPREIGYLSRLIQLNLCCNNLNGSISPNFWLLKNLKILDIGGNSLIGEISEEHFTELQKLEVLDLSSNSLTLSVKSSWNPHFQLRTLSLNSINIGPRFPLWLQNQKKLEVVRMSNASICDNIPDWFEIMHSRIQFLYLSFNNISGKVPKFQIGNTSLSGDQTIYLSSNKSKGISEQFPYVIRILDISNNALDGEITIHEDSAKSILWNELHLSDNYFKGSIPESICHIRDLQVLDLSNNQLSGRLPLCLGNLRGLLLLNLANNSLCGQIPSSLGYIEFLQSLHLNNNNFHGELPPSLQYLKHMQFLDLGENELEGIIPSWIGKGLSNMRILSLKSNNFYGDISLYLCQLSSLQVLDLAQNDLTGCIPCCFNNFSAMGKLNYSQEPVFVYRHGTRMVVPGGGEELASFMSGRQLKFSSNLPYLRSLDLSGNQMVGGIPNELMDLLALQSLKLSGNHLSGTIPEKIGNLKQLCSLDLSMNELSGSIPPSLANLNFLSYLNLSSNKLSGPIPTGNQLQTLTDPSIYAGNSGLCGKPLSNSCSNEKSSEEKGPTLENKDDKGTSFSWFFAGLGPGFGFGFLGIFSILLLKKSWCHAYFQFVENFSNNIWVWIALKALKLPRKLQ